MRYCRPAFTRAEITRPAAVLGVQVGRGSHQIYNLSKIKQYRDVDQLSSRADDVFQDTGEVPNQGSIDPWRRVGMAALHAGDRGRGTTASTSDVGLLAPLPDTGQAARGRRGTNRSRVDECR